jgi:hypothetical protein
VTNIHGTQRQKSTVPLSSTNKRADENIPNNQAVLIFHNVDPKIVSIIDRENVHMPLHCSVYHNYARLSYKSEQQKKLSAALAHYRQSECSVLRPVRRKAMNIGHIHVALKSQKEHNCPRCKEVARLIANIEEQEPCRDKKGNLQYYCLSCHTRFSIKDAGRAIIH